MSDNTVNHPIESWLPTDVWGLIASLLDNDELARFRQVCKLFYSIGSQAMVLQPIYNRLFAIDKTLPADLQAAAEQADKTPFAFLKDTFEKMQAGQQQEIAYLTKHHAVRMAAPAHAAVLQQNTSVTLKSLEAKHALLDTVNSEIVTTRINVNITFLYLYDVYITRLPVTLFTAAGYAHFWQNLTYLYCSNNQLTAMDVTGLAALQRLSCNNNQLTALNVQGLVALQHLDCNSNQLTALNVQGLAALQDFDCNSNQLTALNVQGLVALQRLVCHSNQLTALNVQGLVALQCLCCNNNQLTEMNVQGLVALQWLYCNNNQLTELNVQGLVTLQDLVCFLNPLTDLNLTGVSAVVKSRFSGLERSLLFKRLSASDSVQVRQEIIARLGADYTYINCLYYCPVYAAKLFISDSSSQVYHLASSALSQLAAYLPSFGTNNNRPANPQQKRPRDEEQEPNDEPEAKRRKKS